MRHRWIFCVMLALAASTSYAETVYDLGAAGTSMIVPDVLHGDSYPILGTLTAKDDGSVDYDLSWDGNIFQGTASFLSQSPHIEIGGNSIAPSITNYNDLGILTFSMFAERNTPALDPDNFFDGVNAGVITFIGGNPADTRYGTVSFVPVSEPMGIVTGLVGVALLGFRRLGMRLRR